MSCWRNWGGESWASMSQGPERERSRTRSSSVPIASLVTSPLSTHLPRLPTPAQLIQVAYLSRSTRKHWQR